MGYPWPGNVRELRNVVERIAILTGGNAITESDMRTFLFGSVSPKSVQKRRRVSLDDFDAYEKARILEALKKADGNKSRAAEVLGMSRYRLYRKIRQYENGAGHP